jgi:hypothetical protein
MRTDRLRQLAEHLLHGKLIHEVFDFNFFNYTPNESLILKGCGTNGCAIGECTAVWPEEWRFNVHGSPITGDPMKYGSSTQSGVVWFELTTREFRLLFAPHAGQPLSLEVSTIPVIKQLPETATKEQVAINILLLCTIVDAGIYYIIERS